VALLADSTIMSRGRSIGTYELTNGVTAFAGSLMGLLRSSGRAVLWSDVANLTFLGPAMKAAIGDTSASPPPDVNVNESGEIMMKVPVVGAASIANQGDRVYATDDDTLTLTPTVNAGAIGTVVRWYVSTTCDVRLLTPSEYEAQEDIA